MNTRRRQIVGLARERFTANGYEATTIGELARELGISKAAIAYYFPTKDTFLDEFVTPFVDDLEASCADDDPRSVVSGYLSAISRHHRVAVWVDTDPAIQNHDSYGRRLSGVNDHVTAVVTDGRGKRDQIRALAVLGGIWRPARELSVDDLVDHHDEIVDRALM